MEQSSLKFTRLPTSLAVGISGFAVFGQFQDCSVVCQIPSVLFVSFC